MADISPEVLLDMFKRGISCFVNPDKYGSFNSTSHNAVMKIMTKMADEIMTYNNLYHECFAAFRASKDRVQFNKSKLYVDSAALIMRTRFEELRKLEQDPLVTYHEWMKDSIPMMTKLVDTIEAANTKNAAYEVIINAARRQLIDDFLALHKRWSESTFNIPHDELEEFNVILKKLEELGLKKPPVYLDKSATFANIWIKVEASDFIFTAC